MDQKWTRQTLRDWNAVSANQRILDDQSVTLAFWFVCEPAYVHVWTILQTWTADRK